MLGMFGRKSDHPMANMKMTQALLANLPMNDALKSLHELTGWIESVREQDTFRLDHQFAVLHLLDETARPFERKLMREYYACTAQTTFQENRMWMELNEFSTQALLAYLVVQVRYRNGDKGATLIKDMPQLIAVRGINAAKGILKAAAARYALFDHALWESLAELYSHAEAKQYLDEPIELYPGMGVKTSVRKEFSAVLMWYVSCFGSLGRLDMHLAERLSVHLNHSFTVSQKREPSSLFGFDLLYPMSPMRLGTETVQQPSVRYLGVHNFNEEIIDLLKVLEKNIVPEDINLGGVYEAETVREVAHHLVEHLTSPAAVRRKTRHSIKVSLNVTKGFSGVMERTAVGVNLGSEADLNWQVEDVSVSGLRCILPATGMDGLEIGLLVGTKPDKANSWGVGIVRRLIRDPQKNLHVGIEMLSNQVDGVRLREQGAEQQRFALWLDNPGGDASEVDLLMIPDTFASNRSLHVRMNDKNYLLMPLKLVERGGDYELARYRKIEAEEEAVE